MTPLEQLNARAAETIYSPISEDEMRFVKIHPGRRSDSLRCSLVTSSRSAAPRYDALSYEWGSQENPSIMLLDSQKFRITLNLERALLRLRHRRRSTLVWIDALVINQSNTAERNAQVQQMAHTYQSASTVFIWLGEGNNDILRFLTSASKVRRARRVMSFITWAPVQHTSVDRIVNGFPLFIALTYWSRTWVFQEFLFAKRPVFIYDYLRFDLAVLSELLNHEFSHWEPEIDNIQQWVIATSQLSRVFLFYFHRQVMAHASEMNITEWIINTVDVGASKTSDPRDQVYGVRSLFPAEIRQRIPIDYNTSIAELYSLVTRLVIEKSGDLKILGAVSGRGRVQPNLPSWVLDLSGDSQFSQAIFFDEQTFPRPQNIFFAFEANSTLHVKGRFLGTVVRLASALDSDIHFAGCTISEASMLVSEQVTEYCERLLDELEFNESELAFVHKTYSLWPHFRKPLHTEDIPDIEAHDVQGVNRKNIKSNIRIKLPETATPPDKMTAASTLQFYTSHVALSLSVSGADSKEGRVNHILGFSTPGVRVGDRLVSISGCNRLLVLRSKGDYDIIVGSALFRSFYDLKLIVGSETSSEVVQDYFLE